MTYQRGSDRSVRHGTSSFDALLTSLAVLDSVLIVFYVMDVSYIDALVRVTPDWYNAAYPYFLYPARHAATSACVFMVTAVAANRHQAICNPLRYR